jgi:putative phosphoesterase
VRLIIVSDSHGNIANLQHVMGFAKKIGVEAVVHAGDWDNIESVDAVLSFGIPLYAVLGNADIDPRVGKRLKVRSKVFDEKFLVINTGGKRIGITHKPSDNKRYFFGEKLDLIVNGHLHSKYEAVAKSVRTSDLVGAKEDESQATSVKIIRPGAIVKGINFAVYDTDTGKIDFVNYE